MRDYRRAHLRAEIDGDTERALHLIEDARSSLDGWREALASGSRVGGTSHVTGVVAELAVLTARIEALRMALSVLPEEE